MTQDDVCTVLAPCGKVTTVTVLRDRASGVSHGLGWVERPAPAAAPTAMARRHGQAWKGQTLHVQEARQRAGDRRGDRRPRRDQRRSGERAPVRERNLSRWWECDPGMATLRRGARPHSSVSQQLTRQ